MAQKVCKSCKAIVEEGNRCNSCGSDELAESFKGKVAILNPEKSEIARNMGKAKKGNYAIKVG